MRATTTGLRWMVLSGVVVLATGQSRAQTLEEFLASARTQGLGARQARSTFEARAAEQDASWRALLPRAEVRGGYTRNQYETSATFPSGPNGEQTVAVIVPQDQLEASVRVDLPLVDASRWKRLDTSHAIAQAASAQVDVAVSNEAREVIVEFHEALAAKAIREAADRAVEAAERTREQVRAQRAAGRVTDLEVERATAEVERLRQAAIEGARSESAATRRLESLSGLAVKSLPDRVAMTDGPEEPLDAFVEGAAQVPSVVAAQRDASAAESSAQAAWSAIYPTVGAFAQERFTNATGFLGQSALWAAGVEVNWRFDPTLFRSLDALSATTEAARVREAQARRDARDRVVDGWHDVGAFQASLRSARAEEASARAAAELARDRAAAGALTQADLLQAQRDAVSAEARRIRAEARLAAARLVLRLDAGRPLTLTPTAGGRS